MIAGNVIIEFTEPADPDRMPLLKLTFFVLTMDNHGHITWPTGFEKGAEAQLRKQARALLKKMMEDPLNPVDETMAPALTGTGTSSVWAGGPRRQLVEVAMEVA